MFSRTLCLISETKETGGVREAKTTNKSDPKNVKLVHLHQGEM